MNMMTFLLSLLKMYLLCFMLLSLSLSLEWLNAAPNFDWQVAELCSGCAVWAPVWCPHRRTKGQPVRAYWPLWFKGQYSALWPHRGGLHYPIVNFKMREQIHFRQPCLLFYWLLLHVCVPSLSCRLNVYLRYELIKFCYLLKPLLSCISTYPGKESSSSSDAQVLPRGKPGLPPELWQCPSTSSSQRFPGTAPLFEQPDFPLMLNTKQTAVSVRTGSFRIVFN